MKKKLESELISIAHRILKLKGKEDVVKMHTEASALYEKLSVLKFAHENFEDGIPTIGSDSSFFGMLDEAFNNKVSDTIEIEDKIYINLDEVEDDDIMEPVIEKIKDMVAQMPHETQQVDAIFDEAIPKRYHKTDLEEITAGFKETPVFEPASKMAKEKVDEKKSLNEKLKTGGLNIGLNDKIAFIKHLFDGRSEDYDRVISQLNTSVTFNEAKRLVEDIVKPDYNNWLDKEEFETRFMQIVESKFE
ncbi:hypothetical protein Q4Q39_05755 [Flavivirga amylovorans]|uniref:DUF3387 domain-containing protein n=1 Tax=Flavivirga amylovorans TaxID=870486 RepID=A0ABT8WZ07_9FLAO|nr:hypothetical protein [Flavivirga amylovorans]MDO5986908.1 hypothetical protein [Flavivirga amylovorans]